VDIIGSAKCHSSTGNYMLRGQSLRMGFPRGNSKGFPEKDVARMREGDEFRDEGGKCIDVDSTLLRHVSRVLTRHVY
jgi:hypothetical protein